MTLEAKDYDEHCEKIIKEKGIELYEMKDVHRHTGMGCPNCGSILLVNNKYEQCRWCRICIKISYYSDKNTVLPTT